MNSENKTFIILTPGWAQSEADTNCLPMQQSLVKTLKRTYPQLNIIILAFQYPYFKKTYDWHGTRVTSFNGQNKGGIARLLLRREINAKLKEVSSDQQIIGLLSFWYNECAAVGKKFADRNGHKHYCWLLGQDAKKGNKYIKYVKLRADEMIALSDFLQDEFEKNHGVRPQHVVPPGIDSKQLPLAEAGRDIDILGAGSLIPLKHYPVFIEAIAEIKKNLPHIKAMLIGDGPEKEKLQGLIAARGLVTNITLTGELPHAEVLELMQRTKVFLHTSSYEGFGVVCLEALAAGCHVFSFCKPMKQDIDQWQIVKAKEEMQEKVLMLLQNPGTVYKPVIPFSIEDTAKRMMELFNA
jgi:glycosyltransferase involved in cell wall biosynthesis